LYDFHNSSLSTFELFILNAAILSIIIIALLRSEKSLEDKSPWSMLAILAVFGISGRILFEPLPNFQPVTTIVLLTGVFFGAPRAVVLAGTITLVSNYLFLGHGVWTIFQIIGWGSIGFLGAILSNRILSNKQININFLAIVAATSAFIFDFIVSLSILFEASPDMLLPYLINGLLFDLYHAVGNVVFVAWIASPLAELMHRHRNNPNSEAVSLIASK